MFKTLFKTFIQTSHVLLPRSITWLAALSGRCRPSRSPGSVPSSWVSQAPAPKLWWPLQTCLWAVGAQSCWASQIFWYRESVHIMCMHFRLTYCLKRLVWLLSERTGVRVMSGHTARLSDSNAIHVQPWLIRITWAGGLALSANKWIVIYFRCPLWTPMFKTLFM